MNMEVESCFPPIMKIFLMGNHDAVFSCIHKSVYSSHKGTNNPLLLKNPKWSIEKIGGLGQNIHTKGIILNYSTKMLLKFQ